MTIILLALLLWYVVIPQFIEARHALRSVGALSPSLLVVGVGLELASLACYGALTRAALDPAVRPSYWSVLRIDVVGVGVTNSIPGGGASALAARFRLLARAGTPTGAAAGSLAVEILGSNLLLGAVFATGLVLSLTALPSNPYYRLAGVVVVAIFGTATAMLAFAVRHRQRARRIIHTGAGRLPESMRTRATAFAESALENVAAFTADRRRLRAALIWGAANWLLDAAALYVFLVEFGYRPPVGELLVAYGLAGILAVVPITPGGIGIVEGILVPALVAFGSPLGAAVLAVTAWRLVEFWMPMPLGALAALSLAVGDRPHPNSDAGERPRLDAVRWRRGSASRATTRIRG